jgi:hypothetical protein
MCVINSKGYHPVSPEELKKIETKLEA